MEAAAGAELNKRDVEEIVGRDEESSNLEDWPLQRVVVARRNKFMVVIYRREKWRVLMMALRIRHS